LKEAMLTCPRCQRANPDEGAFCYFDGAELRAVRGLTTTGRDTPLPHEFVFPSGRRCRSYDELVRGCQDEWDVARDLLRQGVFRTFLAGAGRVDLAHAAQHAKGQSDPDLALEAFLKSLPAATGEAPRLDLSPRRINLGTLHVGETGQVRLTVTNQGKGLLHGTLSVAEGNGWLRVGNERGNGECQIKAAHEQQISLRVDTTGLAAPQKYAARLTVITNGGIVEVPVRLELAVRPFTQAPFQGVASPREMAERMRTQPKLAVPLLESGEVARWFAVNGWGYPVTGPGARGVAAVQQFFEGMGLSKPPVVQLADPELYVGCNPGEVARGQVVLRTDARKWVYAHAESDVPWLRLTTPIASGPQQAVLAFEADSRQLAPAEVHEATLRITANAGQALSARVRIGVRRPSAAPGPHLGRPFLVGAAAGLLLRLLLALPADLYARVLAASPNAALPPGSFASWESSPLVGPEFLRHFVLATWWIGALFGLIYLWRRGEHKSDAVFGLVAGGVAGLVASATFGCVLPVLDLAPRLLWQRVGTLTGLERTLRTPWLWTAIWVAWAALAWAVLGAVVGPLVAGLSPAGARLLTRVGNGIGGVLRALGLRRPAAWLLGSPAPAP
jgi:hypothetical protein